MEHKHQTLAWLCVAVLNPCSNTLMAQEDALVVAAPLGYVGLGTDNPDVPLHIVGVNAPLNTVLQVENSGSARIRLKNNATGETWNIGHQVPSGTGLVFSDVGDPYSELLLDVDGNLTITGTLTAGTPPDTFPDYVFAPDYPLLPLDQLKIFVERERHLPRLPSADDVAQSNQLNISELQLLLLEKIEELVLYTIRQDQQINQLTSRLTKIETCATPGVPNATSVEKPQGSNLTTPLQ